MEDLNTLLALLDQEKIDYSFFEKAYHIRVQDFAKLTNRTNMAVHYLLSPGNRIRPLRSTRVCGLILIPITELIDYPFTSTKKGEIYRYNVVKDPLGLEPITIEVNE